MSEVKGMGEKAIDLEKDYMYIILKKYSARDKSLTVDEFIRQELSASNLFSKDEIEETVITISNIISSNNNNYREIQEYKKKGLTTSHWLRDLLDKVTSLFSPEGRSLLITSIKNALNKSNLELTNTGQKMTEIVRPLETDDFTGHHRNIIAENFMDELKINSHIKTIIMEEGMTFQNDKWEGKKSIHIDNIISSDPIPSFPTPIPDVLEYFEETFDSNKDDGIKEVIATGNVIKQKLENLKNPLSTEKITQIADGGISAAKVIYKVGTGKLDPTEAMDYIIDRSAAILGTVTKTMCEKIGEKAGAIVGECIGSIFGPVGTVIGAEIGIKVGRFAGKVVGEVMVVSAVKKVATFAKNVIHAAWEDAKSIGNAVGEGVKSIGRGIFGF